MTMRKAIFEFGTEHQTLMKIEVDDELVTVFSYEIPIGTIITIPLDKFLEQLEASR